MLSVPTPPPPPPPPAPHFFSRLSLKSEIMDGFWSSRCLNDRIDLTDKIGSFSSGATTSMVVKNGAKKTFRTFFAPSCLCV